MVIIIHTSVCPAKGVTMMELLGVLAEQVQAVVDYVVAALPGYLHRTLATANGLAQAAYLFFTPNPLKYTVSGVAWYGKYELLCGTNTDFINICEKLQ